MSKPVLRSLAGVLAWAVLAAAWAGAADGTAALPVEEALRSAARSHPSIASQRGQLRAAVAEQEAARWERFPTLTADSGRSAATGATLTTSRLQQPLWTGGRITSQIEQAQAGVEAAAASVAEMQQTILLDTAAACAELLRASARLEASTRNVAEYERLHQMIQRRARSEVSPEADVTLATGRLQQALSEQLQFQGSVTQARAVLEQLVGAPVQAVAMPTRMAPEFTSATEAVEEALAFSPELQRLRAQIAQARAQSGVARSALWPSVALVHEQRYGDHMGGLPRSQTYIELQYQPGAGLSARSAATAAAERAQSLHDALEAGQRKLASQVQADWADATALGLQLQPVRLLVLSSQGVVDSYARQYTAGRKSWLDVLNAQREAAQAQYAVADVEAARLRQLLRLAILTGRLSARTLDAAP